MKAYFDEKKGVVFKKNMVIVPCNIFMSKEEYVQMVLKEENGEVSLELGK